MYLHTGALHLTGRGYSRELTLSWMPKRYLYWRWCIGLQWSQVSTWCYKRHDWAKGTPFPECPEQHGRALRMGRLVLDWYWHPRHAMKLKPYHIGYLP